MFKNILLTFLGFCPGKESAQGFRKRNNKIISRFQKLKPKDRMKIGVILIFVGLVPYFFIDTSITGVTDIIRLYCSLGLASFTIGVILIISSLIIPLI
jgi:hypothetical protein